ncbi:MAG TPA: LUD domain-containing protein [Candidatus Paceibacterota bacterium]|nr:LUD domain-containing protein [Candidatus Paceibacterota bacterium]
MSTSRDDILNRINTARAGMTTPLVERTYGTSLTLSRKELLYLFEDRILDYQATFVRTADVASTISNILAEYGLRNILLPAGLPAEWAMGTTDFNLSPEQLDQFDCVITSSELGIAATGTIVLNHSDSTQGRRAISLVPDTHICIVQEENVVGTVVEAIRALNPKEHQTWISGPSATSDIELERVEGVHGPRNLHVILMTK